MPIFIKKNNQFIIIISILLLNACAVNNKIDLYYSIPTISYLREGPNYDSPVVTELYNADTVKLLERYDNGWWQVKILRNDNIGWTQRDLLSNTPIIAQNYYITVSDLPLRNSPRQDVISRNLLGYGDTVKKIAEKDGWWRILVEKDKSIGWIPAAMASETPPGPLEEEKPQIAASAKTDQGPPASQPAPQLSYFFVAGGSLDLYIIPFIPSQVVKVLKLNDKVEKISQSGSDWIKIRYLDTGAEGWALARFLKSSPVTDKNQIVTPEKKSPKNVKKFKTEPLEPEGM
ncbi:MAG: SH3 domain-containing protein [Desulfobaccales bacterium]